MDIRLIAHGKDQGNVNKRLAAGKAVGIVKSMPDKIQNISGKAGIKQQQKAAVHRFLPGENSSASYI